MTLPGFKKISTKVALSCVPIALLQSGLSILTLNYVTSLATFQSPVIGRG